MINLLYGGNDKVFDGLMISLLSASKNTKEFRSIINGIIDKPSSVLLFNWISYTQKSLRQKEVQLKPTKLPSFVEALPY